MQRAPMSAFFARLLRFRRRRSASSAHRSEIHPSIHPRSMMRRRTGARPFWNMALPRCAAGSRVRTGLRTPMRARRTGAGRPGSNGDGVGVPFGMSGPEGESSDDHRFRSGGRGARGDRVRNCATGERRRRRARDGAAVERRRRRPGCACGRQRRRGRSRLGGGRQGDVLADLEQLTASRGVFAPAPRTGVAGV